MGNKKKKEKKSHFKNFTLSYDIEHNLISESENLNYVSYFMEIILNYLQNK